MSGVPRLQALLDEGVAAGVFPCAATVVLHRGRRVFNGTAGGATARTVFDLASLTKVMATTTAFLALWREGLVAPEMPVTRVLPESAVGRAGVTVADLLTHRAGLPAFRPFFAKILREMPELREPGCPPEVRAAGRAMVLADTLAVKPEAPRGIRAVYSDVGFIVLGELLARVAGRDLDALVLEHVARPLALAVYYNRLSTWRGPTSSGALPGESSSGLAIAPTGRTRPREPAPGQEGLWERFVPAPSQPGEVDDDNAWAMDGVAGHAGLFGPAGDVATFGQAVLDDCNGAGRMAPTECWTAVCQRDAATSGSTRAMGFDTRVSGDRGIESSAGRLMGMVPPGAVGHTGFTGTSLWVDLGRQVVVALCTNRTAGPRGRAENRISEFRPRFHDAAVEVSVATSP